MRIVTSLHPRVGLGDLFEEAQELIRTVPRVAGVGDLYDVLSHLSEVPDERLRLNELGARLQWTKSRLSHHATRMERRGLVRRDGCESDGRGAWLVLTDAGRRAIEAAAPSHVASVRRHLIDRLSPEQLAALTDISDTIVDHLAEVQGGGSVHCSPTEATSGPLG
jgi:DNA-binding MarR family transcriptional regulator